MNGTRRFAYPVLLAVVAAQLGGLLLTTLREGTPIGTWLFLSLRWSEQASKLFERSGAVVAVLACLVAAVAAARPNVQRIAAFVASAWFAAIALAESHVGGAPFTELALVAHATRIAAPLLLAFWRTPDVARGILRGAVAATFLIHGVEALLLHPGFVDYLLAADLKYLGIGLRQAQAETLLRVIGASDVAIAAVVLSGRRAAPVLAWAAAWGALTALSRVVQGGEGALHQTLIRAANGGLPLVLLLSTQVRSMNVVPSPLRRRLAGAALPALLLLPFAADAQALNGAQPAHLRLVWTEQPSNRATVAWSTATPGGTHEVYLDTQPRNGALGAYAQKVLAVNGEYRGGGPYYHHAQLFGLSPATTYYFVVVSDGNVSPERHFVTAHTDDRAFRLMFGGDSRSGVTERRKMNERMARLAEADPGIVAFAHGGDYIDIANSWTEWNSWLEDHALTFTSAGRVLPIIPARGNHEGDGSMFNVVFGFPGGAAVDYWVTKLGANTTFITLDSESSMGGDQRAWLEQQLKEAQAGRWIIPSYHRPAFPAVKTPSGARQFWVPLFEQYNVDVVCESDGHVLKRTVPVRNEQQDPTGIVYVGEGGLGVPQRVPVSQWYLKSPGMAQAAHHVQVFSFSPQELVYEARLMDGSVADRYVFQPRRTPKTPPAIASVRTESDSRVAVTFAEDMDPATAGTPAAYQLEPAAGILDVAQRDARTYVLSTSPLAADQEYVLTISEVRTAEGGALDQPLRVAFQWPAVGDGRVIDPPAPPPPPPPAPPPPAGCAAAGAGMAWVPLALAVGALAAPRVRRSRRRERPDARR